MAGWQLHDRDGTSRRALARQGTPLDTPEVLATIVRRNRSPDHPLEEVEG